MGTRNHVTNVLGHPAVAWWSARLSGSRLRIVAYHDVPDEAVFRWHLQHLAQRYTVVTGAAVGRAMSGRTPLPARSVWITFDDGHRAVFERAQPLLSEFGFSATAYVCPGLVDTTEPFWWDVARAAAMHGLTAQVEGRTVAASELESALKRCRDVSRRTAVQVLDEQLRARGLADVERRQAGSDQLLGWIQAGNEIGNHTWDHPCLDRCTEDAQRRQVTDAHEWLTSRLGTGITTFAYPNGNWASATEEQLRALGYTTAVGFDHRLASRTQHALRLSRLRLDADAEARRVRAVLSGSHTAVMVGRDRLQANDVPDPRLLPR
jgi:peptidoglycan/xylan/chitin deacetylase (PgdA/CDA1 family)